VKKKLLFCFVVLSAILAFGVKTTHAEDLARVSAGDFALHPSLAAVVELPDGTFLGIPVGEEDSYAEYLAFKARHAIVIDVANEIADGMERALREQRATLRADGIESMETLSSSSMFMQDGRQVRVSVTLGPSHYVEGVGVVSWVDRRISGSYPIGLDTATELNLDAELNTGPPWEFVWDFGARIHVAQGHNIGRTIVWAEADFFRDIGFTRERHGTSWFMILGPGGPSLTDPELFSARRLSSWVYNWSPQQIHLVDAWADRDFHSWTVSRATQCLDNSICAVLVLELNTFPLLTKGL
jgi:hypothetical protein